MSTLEDQASLIQLLERERPDTFSPRWIEQKNKSLYIRLRAHFNGSLMTVNEWLPEKWRQRWNYETHSKTRVLIDEVACLERLLDRLQPFNVTPFWIENNDSALYARLKRKLRMKEGGGVDWAPLLAALKPGWRERWSCRIPKQRLEGFTANPTELSLELVELLEQHAPDIFSSKWIYRKDQELHLRWRAYIHSNTSSWTEAISLLPEKWRTRWRQLPSGRHVRSALHMRPTLEDDIQELVALLDALQPTEAKPEWIRMNKSSLYERLKRRWKNGSGVIDWSKLIQHLPSEWQKRWIPGNNKKLADYLPKTPYEDPLEVENVLVEHQAALYTFIVLAKPKDKHARDRVCRALVLLAQGGNVCAERKLFELLTFIIDDWIEKEPHLRKLAYDREIVHEVLRRCIYYYQGKKACFLHYVWKSLSCRARRIKNYSMLRLDADRYAADGDHATWHDFIASRDPEGMCATVYEP